MRSNEQAPLAADETIVELYWARDERAIEETDRKYGAYLMTVAHRILQSREDSEECLNDTYLKTWNSIPPQRPNCLKAFLTKITRTIAIDRYRKERRQKRVPTECTLSLSELAETLCGDSPEVEYESALVGKVIKESSAVSFENNRQTFEKFIPAKKANLIDINCQALATGYDY